jgi:hypothetical protein
MARRYERLEAAEQLREQQFGVVSRAQLHTQGWTDAHIDHEIRYGRWHAPAYGVLALQNAPLTQEQLPWLGVLHAGSGAALSHLTAARAAGLQWKGSGTIDIITPKGHLVAELPGFFFHQTRRPYTRWVTEPASGPPRIRLAHAALLTAERDHNTRRAIGLLAACVQQRLITADKLAAAIPAIRKLRHGKIFAAALGDIAGGAQSFAEIDIGRLCGQAQLMPPTRQAVRTDADGRRRYLDCEWSLPDGRVIVLEVDGSFHLEVGNWWRDMKRERDVVISKNTVLRCASVEIRLDPGAIVRDLIRAGIPQGAEFVCEPGA